ncbi:hypothetical protein SDJN03_01563, partial [Cucurbita argyrosperma subsp. sororia]
MTPIVTNLFTDVGCYLFNMLDAVDSTTPGWWIFKFSSSQIRPRLEEQLALGEEEIHCYSYNQLEIDYLQDLRNHGVSSNEYPLVKRAVESFIAAEVVCSPTLFSFGLLNSFRVYRSF